MTEYNIKNEKKKKKDRDFDMCKMSIVIKFQNWTVLGGFHRKKVDRLVHKLPYHRVVVKRN